MASTYSSLKIQLMATGENSGTWGNVTNDNLGVAIEEAIAESADVSFSGSNVTISLTDTNASQTARNLRLNLTGTGLGATTALTVPDIEKPYIVNNGLSDPVEVKNSTGANVTVVAGKTMWVYSTGSGVVDVTNHATSLTLGTPLAITSGGTGTNLTTFVNLTSNVTGVLPAANGGTGLSALGANVATFLGTPSSANLINAVTDETGTGSLVFANTPTLVSPVLGTPTSGNLDNCTGLPISTGVSGLGANVATFLGTPSSANLLAAVTDETGTGVVVFGTNPTLTGVTLAGNMDAADYFVTKPTLKDYAVEGSAIGNVGATRTFDLEVANFFSATVDQATTFTFSNPPASGNFGVFVLELTNGGAFTVNFPASVDWPGGEAPELTASGVDQLVFTTRDAGTTWYGFVAGLDIKSP